MDITEIILASIMGIVVLAIILISIIKSCTRKMVGLLTLIANIQGASEDDIFNATKTKDEIYEREQRLKREERTRRQKKLN